VTDHFLGEKEVLLYGLGGEDLEEEGGRGPRRPFPSDKKKRGRSNLTNRGGVGRTKKKALDLRMSIEKKMVGGENFHDPSKKSGGPGWRRKGEENRSWRAEGLPSLRGRRPEKENNLWGKKVLPLKEKKKVTKCSPVGRGEKTVISQHGKKNSYLEESCFEDREKCENQPVP